MYLKFIKLKYTYILCQYSGLKRTFCNFLRFSNQRYFEFINHNFIIYLNMVIRFKKKQNEKTTSQFQVSTNQTAKVIKATDLFCSGK